MKRENLIDKLENKLSTMSLIDRGRVKMIPEIIEGNVTKRLEDNYRIATTKLAGLAYNIAWATTVGNSSDLKPQDPPISEKRGIPISFHDFDTIPVQEVTAHNKNFCQWILNLAVRDLSEFLNYFILGLYETYIEIEYAEKEITASHFVEMAEEYGEFEKKNVNERLSSLKSKFAIDIKHTQELSSLYGLRNILSHYDGIVPKKLCDLKGEFRIHWPVNRYKLLNQDENERESYHRVSKPFTGESYDALQTCWLDNSQQRVYKAGEKILLEVEDLNDLIFFYLYIYDQLQEAFVVFVGSSGIKVKNFKEYRLNPTFFATVDDEE